MNKAEELRRWINAAEHRRAAQTLFDEGLYCASASRSYYACYQAMWVATGDPSIGVWKHGGIAQHFCQGAWATPVLLPTSLASLFKRLLVLYDLRLDADYRALPVTMIKAKEGMDTVAQVFSLITTHKVI